MLARLCFALSLALALVAGRSTRAEEVNKIPEDLLTLLKGGEAFNLLSLDPDVKDEGKDGFHGWKTLGSTLVKDAATRTKIVDAFKKGVDEQKGEPARCFEPRHGIRIVNNGRATDFVICFACQRVEVYEVERERKGFYVSKSPQQTFDEVLTAAKVALPKPDRDSEKPAKK